LTHAGFSLTFVYSPESMKSIVHRKYSALSFAFALFFNFTLSQEITFSPSDTLSFYHIITLKDGTVLKGKIMMQERQTIQFQDEMIGNLTFRTKNVSSMEKVEPQEHYLITMMNGTALHGKIINRKENEITVETANLGIVYVDMNKIKTIKNITAGNMKDGKYWFKTDVDAHYFVQPCAIPIGSGSAYFQNTMALYNSFHVGITSNFSCVGGVILPVAAFISPHANFKIAQNVHAGLGIIAADITGSPYAGAAYGQVTFGNRNAHVSFTGGYGVLEGITDYYYTTKITSIEVGVISISAVKRFSPKYALITENWITPSEGIAILTGGLRLLGEKNSWDFGIANVSISHHITGKDISIGPISFLSFMRNL